MAKDLIGPSAFGAANPAAARPAMVPGNVDGATDTWFQDCTSPTARDGTSLEAAWMNFILVQVRRAVRGMGVVESNLDDDMLLKAIQAASAALPAHTHPESDVIGLVSDLAAKLALAGGTMTGALLQPAGSAAAPSLAASGDTDTGLFYPAADAVALAAGGAERVRATTTGATITGAVAVTAGAVTGGDTRIKTATYPKLILEATGNAADQRKFQFYKGPDGSASLAHLNDAENAEITTLNLKVSGGLVIGGPLTAGADAGTASKVLTGNPSGVPLWKTLAELGMGKKIIAIGTGAGNITVTFGATEPDTSYTGVALFVHPSSTGVQNTIGVEVAASSKTTSGCSFIAPTPVSPNGSSTGIYIVFR